MLAGRLLFLRLELGDGIAKPSEIGVIAADGLPDLVNFRRAERAVEQDHLLDIEFGRLRHVEISSKPRGIPNFNISSRGKQWA